MKKHLVFICLGFVLAFSALSQSRLQFGLHTMLMVGGPIPAKSDPDSTDGSVAVGPDFGAFGSYRFAERWRLEVGLSYAMKGATYYQIYRNDTLVPLEIIPGVVDTVPTYYYARVNGEMNLHYLEVPIAAQWRVSKRIWMQGGTYFGILLGGKDIGSAQIQIGDGTLFPFSTRSFNNINEIRRLDMGFSLGGCFEFDNGLAIEMRGQRSVRGLYQKGFLSNQGLEEIPLYHTQVSFGLAWRF